MAKLDMGLWTELEERWDGVTWVFHCEMGKELEGFQRLEGSRRHVVKNAHLSFIFSLKICKSSTLVTIYSRLFM